MKLLHFAGVTLGVALSASAAVASSLTIDDVSGVWTNVVPSYEATNGAGTNEIRWGTGVNGGPQSGYDFIGATPPDLIANEGVDFVLGTFRHLNFPVTGPGAFGSPTTLDLEVDVSVVGFGIVSTVFSFAHEETPNQVPCAYPGGDPCSDKVTATLNSGASEEFTIGDTTYFFDIVGFQYNGGTFTDFFTQEGQTNEALLIGQFRSTVNVVPLPAAGWLLIAGLGGLLALRRRQ